MTTAEEKIRDLATRVLSGHRCWAAHPNLCSCASPILARGLLAALNVGRIRIATWKVHRNDSPDLPADLWAEVESAIAAAMGLDK